ncbi:glycosyltransferase family 2 protein [uncultured Sphingobacterium sp.]|uniref:glycosyltransferase family 2 protein n=1 Tax=uncultured Sphingobacterium sp. TaxID=182688 RepID=UPI003748CCF9
MKAEPYKISFITVNYNGLADTISLLESILNARLSFAYEVIVIDNGSLKDEYSLIKHQFPNIKGYYNRMNLGFAGGNNLGLEIATGEFIYFLNNDTLLPKNGDSEILAMLEVFALDSRVGGISPKIMYYQPKGMIQFAGCTTLTSVTLRNKQIGYRETDRGQYNNCAEIPYLHGAAMLVPNRIIKEIGVMSELFFLYYEELDWSCRINKKYKLVYFADAHIFHKESASTGQDSPLKIFYLTRNRLLFAYRNRSGIDRILAVFYLIGIVNSTKLIKFVFFGKWRHVGAVCSGTWSGIKLFSKKNLS